jgi:hypothetical protein
MLPDVEDVRQPSKALVARLAAALAAPRRGVRITNPDRAWAYFEAQATRQLSVLRDPHDRLSLVETEEARVRPPTEAGGDRTWMDVKD